MEEILLIRQMKEDDPVAFNRLYEQYKNMAVLMRQDMSLPIAVDLIPKVLPTKLIMI